MATAKSGDGFLNLANELIKTWKGKDGWDARAKDGQQIGAPEVAKGLKALADTDLMSVAKIFAGDKVTLADSAIAVAEDAITTFQENYVKGASDGIFGIVTWKAMKNLKGCAKADDSTKANLDANSVASVVNSTLNKHMIFYFIDSSVPATIGSKNTAKIITDAWGLWVEHADFGIVKVKRKSDANVVINLRSLGDGPGGMLGLAHVGGPSISQQLECSMDDAETWTPDKFKVAIAHEFGHILGLTHAAGGGQLMSPFLSNITKPQSGDISRIQGLWGKPPETGEFVTADEDDPDVR